ncbi:hypothetical protein NNO_1506 [Hydrogenimonas sp.]|nr:hypothetical protein NNO_1506 [Hydrogenimonas sp.]
MSKALKELTDYMVDVPLDKESQTNIKSSHTFTATKEDVVYGRSEEPVITFDVGKTAKGNREVRVTTYGYIGSFHIKIGKWEKEVSIGYRFGKPVLERMVARSMGFDSFIHYDRSGEGKKKAEERIVIVMMCLAYVLAMEKATALGLPQGYRRREYRESSLRGQVDVSRFVRKDIPFMGKISSVLYERVEAQEIIDLLDAAFGVVERENRNLVNRRVWGIRQYVRERASRRFVDRRVVEKALGHRLLKNPLYAHFKKAVELAARLIRLDDTQKEGKFETYLFDVNAMWEGYVYALLKEAVESDEDLKGSWRVLHEPELPVYEACFFRRLMKPDVVIVNESEKRVLVLDAKSKRMACRGSGRHDMGDLDRGDFFQLHTYMSYYRGAGYEVLGGGLLYPMEKSCAERSCEWFGDEKGSFFVEGLELDFMDEIDRQVEEIDQFKENYNPNKTELISKLNELLTDGDSNKTEIDEDEIERRFSFIWTTRNRLNRNNVDNKEEWKKLIEEIKNRRYEKKITASEEKFCQAIMGYLKQS